jgi:hypothetical protein
MARLRRALRVLLASSLALALWMVARPALAASAPFCDDRAASATAPAPALEAPDVGIQRARVAAACAGEEHPFGATLRHGRPRSVPSTMAAEPALLTGGVHVVSPPGALFEPPRVPESPGQSVRSRIERPPRG